MSEIEISIDAVVGAMVAASDQDYDAFPVRISSNRAAHMLRSVYPSIRRQVLESVVEDVAKAFAANSGNERVFDDDWFAGVRALHMARAGRVLGLASEGEGS